MMKFLRYILISITMFNASNSANACWSSWGTPRQLYMYRVYVEPIYSANNESDHINMKNCKEWQRLTSDTIPLQDIYNIVYKSTLADFETLYNHRKYTRGNKFAEWITQKDTTILNFLLLAKNNEHIRLNLNSRWYYPSMKIDTRMTIEEVAEKALSIKDNRLRDRYLLQGVRALFSMAKYQECIDIWNNEVLLLPEDNLMRQMIHPYIAGAEFRLKRADKAAEYFAEIGDVQSILFCLGRSDEKISTIDALKLVCQYAPNSQHIPQILQSLVREIEPMGDFYRHYEFEPTPEYSELYELCIKMGKSNKSENPAMWYYTAAFLSDLFKNQQKASELLTLAENSKASLLIEESIKVFRMYLDAKQSDYNASYERKLFSQIKWLDSKICDNLDDRVRQETAHLYNLYSYKNYYYWNDMLRRILLSEVCPRMIEAGNTTRALQLANMADNRLLGLVNIQEVDYYDPSTSTTYSLSAYRYSNEYNTYDYSNHFFEMIDSMDVASTKKYVQNTQNPKTEFDKFLNSRGYTGYDYLFDILGTQYLRNMQYKEALTYFGKVSEAYKNHHNLHMIFDPFTQERVILKPKNDFRYEFAAQMYSLEQTIQITADPNRKARLILQYAIGLHNSFDKCWELTQYYKGSTYWGQVCEKREWEKDKYTLAAKARAKELIETACRIPTNEETAADIHYQLHLYRTVAEKYPNTEKGLLVKGKCDNLVDYEILKSIENY